MTRIADPQINFADIEFLTQAEADRIAGEDADATRLSLPRIAPGGCISLEPLLCRHVYIS